MVAVIGIAIRVALTQVTPAIPMLWDHHEYVVWGQRMIESGPLALYDDLPPKGLMRHPKTGKVGQLRDFERQRCNYPPLATVLIYGETAVLKVFDPNLVSNTHVARLIFAVPAMVTDLILAAGCLAIIRRLGGSNWIQLVGFATVALGPPFVIDCAIWGQTDSWVLAPLVWMIRFMMDRRWVVSGILWGIALGLKTQAVLAAPIWLVALILIPRFPVIFGGLVALSVLLASGLPYTLASGWGWFERAFVHNLLDAYPKTTLYAFNLWYLDLLFSENDDAGLKLLGVTKDTWGKLLLALALLVSVAWSFRRRWRDGSTIVLFGGLWLMFAVMLPTRVHERYIILPIPFLIAATGLRRRLWWAVAPLMIAATFQLAVLHWMPFKVGAHSWAYVTQKVKTQYERLRSTLTEEAFSKLRPPREELRHIRPQFLADRRTSGAPLKEWALTILELASFVACVVLIMFERNPLRRPASAYGGGDDG